MTTADQDVSSDAFLKALTKGLAKAKAANGIAGTAPLQFSIAFSDGFCEGWNALLELVGVNVSSDKAFAQDEPPTEGERIMQIAQRIYGQELAHSH